jgi:hypothetical protein
LAKFPWQDCQPLEKNPLLCGDYLSTISMAFIRILLIIILVYYLIRFLDKYIVPAIFGSTKKDKAPPGKKEKEFRKSTGHGDVTITDFKKRDKGINSKEGDYVDYEEID